ncbi:MAG: flavin reductase family protein [Clostridia bacterium]|uniref:flavin reductase family protein n=1 Tax=Brotomerdimonas butyrica TaxID=2981721 RepID=UPI000821640D|nr:flavin reductase family protein [Brotomerdimonas butyrica]MCI5999827.1 flavin reductase family protein [Eubacteriaceae bacterium]MDD6476508.1 flavin reductase family protein [Eubacteriales bacterium]SCH86622.1 Flavoredoxin [uncultured Eubacterium sp.]MCU6756471.1 flavin reductase family protein [Brotomerdimonas butyrica]MDY3038100.1 flavin reductase family protein [Eubacteriales bacterium]
MSKTVFKPGTMLNPVPAVMVSCGDDTVNNIITIAWTGIINSDPPITYVSVRKSRYSHDIIERTGEFVINLTTEKLAFAADYCGVRSGRDVDKFKEMKLTAAESKEVSCPSIEESPVNIECRVMEMKEYPTHDMFIAEIVSVSVDDSLMDETGKLCLDEAGLVAYNHGHYFALQKKEIGRFGYSVMKPKTRKRIEAEKRRNSGRKRRRR